MIVYGLQYNYFMGTIFSCLPFSTMSQFSLKSSVRKDGLDHQNFFSHYKA